MFNAQILSTPFCSIFSHVVLLLHNQKSFFTQSLDIYTTEKKQQAQIF